MKHPEPKLTLHDYEIKIEGLREALQKCKVVINRTNDWDSAVADALRSAEETLKETA